MKPMDNDTRTAIQVFSHGAGRGAQQMQIFYAATNDRSQRFRFDPTYVDPAPGKAAELAAEGEQLGLITGALESTGEDFLGSAAQTQGLDVVAIDNAEAIARIIERETSNTLFIYCLLDLPGLGLTGWRFILRPEDVDLKLRVSGFFRRLARVTAPSGSREVLGDKSPTKNRLLEGRHREWFTNHFERNAIKVVHGLEPETAPAEITYDGRTTSRLEVLEVHEGWRSEAELFAELQRSLREPVRRGTEFAVAELGPENAIQIHRIRYRRTDGQFGLIGGTWDPAARAREQAQRVRSPSVLSMLNAAFLSD